MELQESDVMARYSAYDVSVGAATTKWYLHRKTQMALAVTGAFLLIAVGLFLGGFYTGVSANKTISESLEVTTEPEPPTVTVPEIEWDGVCPKKQTVCPESYEGIPPLLLVSLDGFRPDYLQRGLMPTLANLTLCGSNAPHMYPVFPSKTFPNHYSIVTGLHPVSHGIIENTMYDPLIRKLYKVGNHEFLKSYWYEAEPIWVTAQKQGKRSSIFFYPGSEVEINGIRPNDFRKYKATLAYEKRVDTILEWLDRRKSTRPDFLSMYVFQPDKAAHQYGKDSKQVNDELVRLDNMIARLVSGLQQRNLLNCVNIIILSDHGATDVSCTKLINLMDYNVTDVRTVVGSFARIRPLNGNLTESMIADLQCKNEHMRVYPKAQLPVRYHYANHRRIEPIFIDIDAGWTVVNEKPGPDYYCLKANHGYDNYFPDMRAFFMAYGPSFKSNNTIKPFLNIELYELMCEIMNITANPNNGTKGSLHDLLLQPEELPPEEEPESPQIATVATTQQEYDIRIYAANCSCAQGSYVQQNVENATVLKAKHAPFGLPYSPEDTLTYKTLTVLYNNDYISAYDFKYGLPMWASFTLSKQHKVTEIAACWRGDARIPYESTSKCSSYNVSIVANKSILQSALFPLTFANSSNLEEALFITNSVPKYENHVLLIERRFLEVITTWVRVKNSLNVVTGPAFDFYASGIRPGIDKIMENHSEYGPLVVPTHYFYVITWCETRDVVITECAPSHLDVIAFLLPNVPIAYNCESPDDLIKKNVARVADVELLSGITFFTGIPVYEAIRLRTKMPVF